MRIDLNADVGELAGQDAELMTCITSANVACGAHAGDEAVMADTVRLAKAHGVAVGAHPGFPDREGFGRRDLRMPPDAVAAFVAEQVQALAAIASQHGVRLQHVKPHGALFNIAVEDRSMADAIARAIASIDTALILFGLPGSHLIAAGAAAGLPTAREVFADRAYRADGTLLPRSEPGAVIHDADRVLARVVTMVKERVVVAVDGTRVPLGFDTMCVHGDTPGAAQLAAQVRAALVRDGIEVKSLSSA